MPDTSAFKRRLEAMSSDAAGQSRVAAPAAIRRQAGRRRAIQVAGTSLATVGVVVGAWVVGAPGASQDSVEPATESPSTSSAPHPSATTGTTPAEPTDPPSSEWVTLIPAGLTLPHEGVQAQHSEESDWGPIEDSDAWLMDPCDSVGDPYPSDPSRTDYRGIVQTAIEHLEAEQLAVYPSDTEARRTMRLMRQALDSCGNERTVHADDSYTDSTWDRADAVDVTSDGGLAPDEAFQAWNWNRSYDAEGNPAYGLGGGFFTVSRVGNAIFMTTTDGETDWAAPDAAQGYSDQAAQPTRGFLDELCSTFSGPAGC